jgi:DNA-binding NarL/FixJ family response regulator
MNILIADDLKINRLALKLHIHKQWPEAVVYEASSMHEVVADVFDVVYDLLILDIDMPGSELLESFVAQAIKYTKVVIFSSYEKEDKRVENLVKIGAEAFISKTAQQDEVISILQFVFSYGEVN